MKILRPPFMFTNWQMNRVKNYTILLVTALGLLWPLHVRGELVKLRVEGRIHKVDVAESAHLGIEVGANFLFELSYDTDEKGVILIRDLTIDSVERLAKQEIFFGRVNHSSKVGSWERLRLTVDRGANSLLDGSVSKVASFSVKVVLNSLTDLPSAQAHDLPINGSIVSVGSETFFYLVFFDNVVEHGPGDLISGEITSLTKVDG